MRRLSVFQFAKKFRSIGSEKSLAIEVDHVIRRIGDPHFGFPCNRRVESRKGGAIGKCRDKDEPGPGVREERGEFVLPFLIYRAVGSDCFDLPFSARFILAGGRRRGMLRIMTITLPDLPALRDISEGDILLDLACGAYAAGHLSRQLGADVAGVSRHDFDEALYARRIPTYSEEMLAQDLETLRSICSR